MKSLNRIEIVVGGILVLIFLIWSFDRCQSNSNKYQPVEAPQEKVDPPTNQDQTANTDSAPVTNTAAPKPVAPTVVVPTPTYSSVFVHVDQLKLRDKPFLKESKVLAQFSLKTELSYLGNKTTYKDKITLNNVAYDEPWLEVQTKDGKYKGWIYAGGVRAYQAD